MNHFLNNNINHLHSANVYNLVVPNEGGLPLTVVFNMKHDCTKPTRSVSKDLLKGGKSHTEECCMGRSELLCLKK